MHEQVHDTCQLASTVDSVSNILYFFPKYIVTICHIRGEKVLARPWALFPSYSRDRLHRLRAIRHISFFRTLYQPPKAYSLKREMATDFG